MKRASWLAIASVMACGPLTAPAVQEPAAPANEAAEGAERAAKAAADAKAAAEADTKAAEKARTPPALRLPGGARPLRYDVELTLDPASEDFAGTIGIELELAAPTRVLWLSAEEIEVQSATFDAGGAKVAARPISQHEGFLGLEVERPLAAGRARLQIAYRGKARRNDGDGIYTFEDGGAWYAFTQFQATDARQAFPCFDEPSYKVPWRLAIRTKKELVALANTPALSEQDAGGGMKVVQFAETRPLPSYLVAFAVGPFELVDAGKSRGGAPIRIVVPRGRGKEVAYPVQATRPILDLLEDYFGIPYPYEKLDIAAVPVFNAGAMENPGLITYRQELVLTKPGEETLNKQQAYAAITAHEIAHQWFGNYVTLAWWDDTWLNEAFATWMASKVIEQWKPAWDAPVERVASKGRVMAEDSLDSARAIRQPIATAGDIRNAFDGITYQKGQAVLTMIERWIGPEAFRDGVRAYLAKHAWGNATYADFVGAVSAAAGRDLGPVLDSFVLQSGIPLVSFELACSKDAPPRLRLGQQRYKPTGSQIDPQRTWHVPVCVRWGAGAATGRDCTVLAAETAELPLSAKACPDWVMPNEAGIGYYRMQPKGDLLDRLLARAPKALTLAERVGLVGDVNALVGSGEVQKGVALALVDALSKDRSRHIVDMSIGLIAGLDDMVTPELRPSYERLIRRLYRARAVELGWRGKRSETDDHRQLRPALLSLVAGQGRDPELGAQATALAWKWLDDRKAVDPELVRAVLAVAARRGDQKLFDRLLADAQRTTDRIERARLLDALGSFVDPKLVSQAMAIMLTDQFDLREGMGVLFGGFQNPATRPITYRFVVDNFDAISSKMPPPYRPFLAYSLVALCDDARKAEAEAFFRPRIEKLDGGPRILAQALEQLSLCAAAKQAQTPGVVAYLKKQ
jgi:cytosol alanyl aminopeptidase